MAKITILAATAFFAAISLATATSAAVFDTRAAFDATVTHQAIARFDGVAAPTGYVEYPFLAPYVENGLTFVGAGNMLIIDQDHYANSAYEGGGFLNNAGDPDGAFLIQFVATNSIGFDFGGLFANPVYWTVTLSNGEVYETGPGAADIVSNKTLDFFGLTSDTAFTWAQIDTPRGSSDRPFLSPYNAVDNFTVGLSAVPEPAAWGLMIGGFAFAGSALRQRKSGSRRRRRDVSARAACAG